MEGGGGPGEAVCQQEKPKRKLWAETRLACRCTKRRQAVQSSNEDQESTRERQSGR